MLMVQGVPQTRQRQTRMGWGKQAIL